MLIFVPYPDPRRRGAQPLIESEHVTADHRSPQARGSTGVELLGLGVVHPIPAGAGLNR